MNDELKITLGKLLGETYRVQKEQGIARVDDGRIYGLLNGFEEAIESEFGELDLISNEQISIVSDYLMPYYNGEKSTEDLPNFLHLRMDLERQGISHGRLIQIFKYLKATSRFNVEIDKCGGFELEHDV